MHPRIKTGTKQEQYEYNGKTHHKKPDMQQKSTFRKNGQTELYPRLLPVHSWFATGVGQSGGFKHFCRNC
jgi:hypothetical protein